VPLTFVDALLNAPSFAYHARMGEGRSTRDVFERWTPVWHAFFYVMIVVSTAILFSSWASDGRAGPRTVVLVLDAALVTWHAVMLVPLGRSAREHPVRVVVYLVGATAASAGLLLVDPIFLMVAMPLYNQIFAFLVMRWAVPIAVALTAVITAMFTRYQNISGTIGILVGAASALVFAYFLSASSEESRKRRALIEELERTRGALALAERLAGVTEERARIARELHDTVTQQLIGIVMHLDAASERVVGDPARAKTALEESLRLAREGLAESRRIVWTDKPRQLETGALSKALAEAIEETRATTNAEIDFVCDPELDTLPAALQTLVLRGVREALANVKKHAHAKRVTVSTSVDDDFLMVDVQDDGSGFDETSQRPVGAGFGLKGLCERVESHGGTLSIETAKGAGTTVAFHVPLRQKSA
jgi:signal transduction histidine kinase